MVKLNSTFAIATAFAVLAPLFGGSAAQAGSGAKKYSFKITSSTSRCTAIPATRAITIAITSAFPIARRCQRQRHRDVQDRGVDTSRNVPIADYSSYNRNSQLE